MLKRILTLFAASVGLFLVPLSAQIVNQPGGSGGGPPSGACGGDLGGTFPNCTVVGINSTNLAGLATGLLKNTTATGVPLISKVTLTEPATAATLTLANNSSLITSGAFSTTLTSTATTVSTLPAGTHSIAPLDSPSFTTPSLGVATATSINGLTLTSSTGTFTLANGKTFVVSNGLTLTATDGSTLAIGGGGTLGSNAYTSTAYAPLASPTFTGTVTIPTPFTIGAVSMTATGTQLNFLNAAGGTTGTASTNLVFSTSPTLVTPVLGTPTSVTLTNATGLPVSTGISGLGTGVATFLATPSGANFNSMISGGGVPVVPGSHSAAYTTVLADCSSGLLHPTADNNARTFTIDSNANVACPVGSMMSFVNQINTLTIAITSDTLQLAGSATTGSRTLAAGGVATAWKITTTLWIINGTGLT